MVLFKLSRTYAGASLLNQLVELMYQHKGESHLRSPKHTVSGGSAANDLHLYVSRARGVYRALVRQQAVRSRLLNRRGSTP